MASVNINNIQKKIKLPKAGSKKSKSQKGGFNISLNNDDVKRIIDTAVYTLSIAFHSAINDAEFNSGAKAAIGDIKFEEPEEDDEVEGRYIVYGKIDKNMRESLIPNDYPNGAEDMAALMNNGYTADKQVYGIWHGKKTASLTARPAKNFVQQAISDFNNSYGSDLNATAELINKDRFEKSTNTVLGT